MLGSVPSLEWAELAPLSSEDWELAQLNAGHLEASLLQQSQILAPRLILPVWLSGGLPIFLQVRGRERRQSGRYLD